jgi:HeH/LEM domain
MDHTSISDYELDRGDGAPPCEGVEVSSTGSMPDKAADDDEDQEEETDDEEGWEAYTVAELKDTLDRWGVEYPSNARKADLIELAVEAEG